MENKKNNELNETVIDSEIKSFTLSKDIKNITELNKDEVYKYSKAASGPYIKRLLILAGLIMVFGLVLIILSKTVNSLDGYFNFGLGFCIVGLILLAMPFLSTLSIKRQINRQQALYGKGFSYEYTFTNNTVSVKTLAGENTSKSEATYESLLKYILTEDAILLFPTATAALTVKYSGFSNPSDLEEIKKLLATKKMGSKK